MDIGSMRDETFTMGSSKDPHHRHHQSMIMKGKRTKRPRQPSPASAVFTASSGSSGGDGGGGGKMHTKIRLSSESLCSEILSTSTEEDEDMANCLILLAQSGGENIMSTTIKISNKSEKQEEGELKSEKISSKKFKEMVATSTTNGVKAGIFVYECKTCDRSFPSFQALGGHRTSHKKHKPTVEMEEKKGKKLPPLDDHHHQENKQDEQEKGKKFLNISPSSLLSLEIPNKNFHASVVINSNNNKVKIHECSICGAEFASGQALGGHMRRHRIPTSTTTPATVSSNDAAGERPRNILELDLNLPAPPEDDLHDSQLQFSLFSSPALVDCKY